jgi:hypothetical protein
MTSPTGRRPVIDYVTKDYEGFKQGMLNQIPQLLPAWTDRGESDFGVVLVELFAYVADILSYYQDRVANEAYLATATQRRSVTELLRLIDYQIDPGLAASAHLHVDVSADVTVTGRALPYRVTTAGRPGEPDVTFEVTREFTARLRNNAIDLAAVPALPAGATGIVLPAAAHALAEGDPVYLQQRTVRPDGGVRVRRSPMLTLTGVRTLPSGDQEIGWIPPLPEPFQPASTVLKGNNVPATHGTTVADEPVHVSDGTPGQRFALSRMPVTHLLRTEEVRRRRSAPELRLTVDDVPWTHVETLATSGPADPHFTTAIDDRDVLTVTLGTGAHGAIPPAGARVVALYRVGMGAAGNVGPDALTTFVTAVPEVTAVGNPFAAAGGADRESTEEAKLAGPGSVIAQERAVTLEDFELLAEGFPGVGKAKARVGLRGGYKVVQVFVVAEDPATIPPPPPAAALRVAVKRHLEARMPVNRMAGVDVLDPVFVPVDLVVDVHVKADANRATVLQAVEETLRDLLSFARQDFGRPVRVGEVFSALYPTPGVDYVVLRRLERRGEPAPDDCGFADVPIAEHELAYAGLVTVNALGGRT